jgi:dTDP-4-amino-4,6-dideoxygalactose transaminase
MQTETIPFLNLEPLHRALEGELMGVFQNALRTGRFIGGPMVEKFEASFADFCTTRHAVAVNSGTDAMRLAIIASGIRRGDVVMTVPNTFIATTEAISQAGAYPEFIDIDEKTYNLDPRGLVAFLEHRCVRNRRTGALIHKASGRPVRGVVPVHLYGQMADMEAILDIAAVYGLIVIEDACQAHGASYYSAKRASYRKAGAVGRAAAFSFYPGKNLGALGEGGAVTTDDDALAAAVRMLRDHGQSRKYYHEMEGYNGRLDAIQAGLLSVKLGYLDHWNDLRRKCAHYYNQLFSGVEHIVTPYEPAWSRGVYHLYVIRARERDRLQNYLSGRGIGTGLHYPVPLHLQKAYAKRNYRPGDFPVCEKIAGELLSLPMFPDLTADAQRIVAGAVADFMAAG